MHEKNDSNLDASGLCIGLAVSRYHAEITESLRRAAVAVFIAGGGNKANLQSVCTPGTFELTAICRALAMRTTRAGRPALHAIVALGCVITGETTHDQYITHSVTEGLTAITVATGMPFAFGVLTCQNLEQAKARSSSAPGGANKGAEAMIAAIHAARAIRAIEDSREYC